MSRAELSFDRNRIDQRVVLLNPATQQIRQRAGLAFRLQPVVFIFHGRALAQHQVSALADIFNKILGGCV